MENAISVTISPLQMMLSLAFQAWIIVFPIILIRKINYLIALIESEKYEEDTETFVSDDG
ncbi:MAG: hypothetical protein KKD07_05540 [Candidatus Omnitrophica bacterium]|nr:hypothetical protein [Candidatus Omnitrophota bacterium]MBU1996326.1 hypothetical protein [Candidatus Omnitrophota bacterium]MBU4333884.1 hypothetical protein [Candidatus Omnitrophota bacterium]